MAAGLVLAFMVGGVGAPAAAQPTRAAVEQLLRGYERAPTPADVARPGVPELLMEIHRDQRAAPLLRVRALGALRHARGPRVCRFLRHVVRRYAGAQRGLETLFLRRAAAALVAVEPHQSARTVAPLLRHRAADVRVEVARALARHAPKEALPLLARRLGREPLAPVRAVLARAVKRLQRQGTRVRQRRRGQP